MYLISYLYRQSGRLFALATFASIISGLSAAGLVAVLGEAISEKEKVQSLALLFLGLCAVFFLAKSCAEVSLLHLTQSMILHMRTTLPARVLNTPQKKLQHLQKHGLHVIMTKDVDNFIDAFQLLPQVFGNAIVVAACLGYMAWLSLTAFAIFAACLLICTTGFHFFERRPLAELSKVREQMDMLYKNFRSLIEGSRELQLNGEKGHAFIDQVIRPQSIALKHSYTAGMVGYTWVTNTGGILFYLVIGMLVFLAPAWSPDNTKLLVAITIILLYVIQPISDMMGALPGLRQAGISLKKIRQLDDMLENTSGPVADSDPFGGYGSIQLELKGVCHRYPSAVDDSQFLLGPINLTICRGEIIFIAGGNGCGKTTLAMLILGLFEPENGSIYLNQVAVNSSNLKHYRSRFSAVFSDFHLFEELLNADDPKVSACAAHYIKLLDMEHKVTIQNGRFSTVNLSTGQRKRLALVATYLEDRDVYLFDEWAADQDPVFKRVFYTTLLPELRMRGKTVLAITHDEAYFGCADRLIQLEHGNVRADLRQQQ